MWPVPSDRSSRVGVGSSATRGLSGRDYTIDPRWSFPPVAVTRVAFRPVVDKRRRFQTCENTPINSSARRQKERRISSSSLSFRLFLSTFPSVSSSFAQRDSLVSRTIDSNLQRSAGVRSDDSLVKGIVRLLLSTRSTFIDLALPLLFNFETGSVRN